MRSLIGALAVVFMGCGGSVAAESGDAGPDAPVTTPPGTRPPPASGGKTMWFAVSKFQLGLTKRTTGTVDASAWKDYGFDLDAVNTTKDDSKTSKGTCKRVEGSPTNVLADGNDGRDNNFGQHVMSVVKSLKADAEEAVNGGVTGGTATLLLKLDNVAGLNNGRVPGELYVAARRGSCAGGWAIDRRSVGATGLARVSFPNGYMSNGTWVSEDPGKGRFDLPLPWVGTLMQLPLEGWITFRPSNPTDGMIGGGTRSVRMVEAFTPMLLRFGICPGNATYDQVAATTTQSADLVSGAPNLQNPAATCDAVSFGLGFAATEIPPVTCTIDVLEEPSGECLR